MLNLSSKCRAEFRLSVDIQFVRFSWDFHNQNSKAKRAPVSSFSNLEKCAQVTEVTSKAVHISVQKPEKHNSYGRHDKG